MVRETAVFIYLRLVSILFAVFRILPLERKVVFVVSFSDNSLSIYEEMLNKNLNCAAVFLATKKAHPHLADIGGAKTLLFEPAHPLQFIRSIYHLSTARLVFVDNYYGFLASARFNKETKCIQLWHANGAIKKFGLEDGTNAARSSAAINRFKRVYEKFDHIVVSSDAMSRIFQLAFGLDEQRMLKTGVPRTDAFFKEAEAENAARRVYSQYPGIQGKKAILYAPTYRDEHLDAFELRLNPDILKKELGEEYVLLLRLHPAIRHSADMTSEDTQFVYDVSGYPNLNDLLFVSDVLITDYSSIPFEYSLLKKPMYFFPYDLTEYKKTRGLWEDFDSLVPGPVLFSTAELARAIRNEEFDYGQLEAFNQKWNRYANGNASSNLVDFAKSHLGLDVRKQVHPSSDLSH